MVKQRLSDDFWPFQAGGKAKTRIFIIQNKSKLYNILFSHKMRFRKNKSLIYNYLINAQFCGIRVFIVEIKNLKSKSKIHFL